MPAITAVTARAYTIPTDAPEADGTFAWDSTTLVVVHVEAGGRRGLGYTYADATDAALLRGPMAAAVRGRDAFDIPACHAALRGRLRNLGQSGLGATALSALDTALWDLKARLLDLPLAHLLGLRRESVAIYGSGGFTSYDDARLREQLATWVQRDGCRAVKMKVGSEPSRDPARVDAALAAIGDATLFVDANGACSRKQALALAERWAAQGVAWFEEPVSGDDLAGLRLLRDQAPPPLEIAAGEYAYSLLDVRRMLEAGAVDVQQADISRCGGVTGFLAAGVLCDAFQTDLSGHCAPALHLHAACAVPRFRHLEWFHDHVRIEQMLFDGAPRAEGGCVRPDLSRPGMGLEFREGEAERFAV